MTWVRMSLGLSRVTRFRPTAFGLGVLAVVATVALIGLVISMTSPPERVDRLKVENQTEFPLEIEVSRAGGESWLGVGVVGAGDTKEFVNVIDQGAVWVFRFSGQGETSSHLTYTRQYLVAGDWTLVIPKSVGEELLASGVEPPP